MTRDRKQYAELFFGLYFIYYGSYSVFSAYSVLFLTSHGFSPTVCGLVTSLALLFSLVMEPVAGYATDTILTTRQCLSLFIFTALPVCVLGTLWADNPVMCAAGIVILVGLIYPFAHLIDAWTTCSAELDPGIIYSRVRAGGSIGFALFSALEGLFFRSAGFRYFFLVPAAQLLLILVFLHRLPNNTLRNRRGVDIAGHLSFWNSVRILLRNRPYMIFLLISTLYWFSNKLVGGYLSLIVMDRSGDAGVYGNICSAGTIVEFLFLLLVARRTNPGTQGIRHRLRTAFLTLTIRPLLLCLFPALSAVLLGQLWMSVSFAALYSGNVHCFSILSDPRIKNFSVSAGLTLSSAAGMMSANLVGGLICERLGLTALCRVSAVSAIAAALLYFSLLDIHCQKTV